MLDTDQTDLDIILGLNRGDPAAMHGLYLKYNSFLYAFVVRTVKNPEEAEEIVQETFLRVWTHTHLVRDTNPLLTAWLLTIARNLTIDHFRASHRQIQFMVQGEGNHQMDEVCVDDPRLRCMVDAMCLVKAFSTLTVEQRAVITLAYWEGMSQMEISVRLARPLGTVKSWTRTALRILRESL